MIKEQPAEATTRGRLAVVPQPSKTKILSENWQQLLHGAGITLF